MVQHILAGPGAAAGDHVQHAGGQQVADELHQSQHAQGGGGGGLKDDAVAGRQGGGQLPSGHQEGEVPGDNLPHHADGLVEDDVHKLAHMVLQDAGGTLLGADGAGEVPEVVGGIGHVDGHGFPDGLAVVHGLDGGQQFLVLIDDIGDLQQDGGALIGFQVPPSGERSPGGLDGSIHIFLGCLGTLRQLFARGGVGGGEVFPTRGGNPLSIDIKFILGVQIHVHNSVLLSIHQSKCSIAYSRSVVLGKYQFILPFCLLLYHISSILRNTEN